MRYDFSKIPSVRKRKYLTGGEIISAGSGALEGAMGIMQASSNLNQTRDVSSIRDAIRDTNAYQYDESSNDNLLASWNNKPTLRTDYTWREIRGGSKGQRAGNVGVATGSGALAGASIGSIVPGIGTAIGAAAGALVGLGSSLVSMFSGNRRAKRKAAKINKEAEEANENVLKRFGYSSDKVQQKNYENMQKNFVAEGGPLHQYKFGSWFNDSANRDLFTSGLRTFNSMAGAVAANGKPEKPLKGPYVGGVSRNAYQPAGETTAERNQRTDALIGGLSAPLLKFGANYKKWDEDNGNARERRIQKSLAENGGTQWVAEGGNLRDKGGMLNEGEIYDLTPNEIVRLKKQGYKFEYV